MSSNLGWLEYKFQAIWLFEIADKYTLYHDKFKDKKFKNNY